MPKFRLPLKVRVRKWFKSRFVVGPHTYRLYDQDLIYRKTVCAHSYVEAARKLKPEPTDRIFCVEKDGHEIECGAAYFMNLLPELEGDDQDDS
jgi:hypothetical protein